MEEGASVLAQVEDLRLLGRPWSVFVVLVLMFLVMSSVDMVVMGWEWFRGVRVDKHPLMLLLVVLTLLRLAGL